MVAQDPDLEPELLKSEPTRSCPLTCREVALERLKPKRVPVGDWEGTLELWALGLWNV